MTTEQNEAQPIRLTFDGCGFNDLDDEYRTRFATLTRWVPLEDERCAFIVRAVNSHAALVEALEGLISTAETRDRQAIEDALIHGRAALAAAKVTK